MSSGLRRAPRSLPTAGACAGALLFIFLLQLAGCRDNGTDPGAQFPQTVMGLVFAPGDSLIFDAWDLDPYNDVNTASHTNPLWKVLSLAGSYAGAAGVTTIAEYPRTGANPDTLRFQFLSSGDIFQYGFIAGAVRRRDSVLLAPSWDRIAAFSLQTNAVWTVGPADSSGLDLLRGTVKGDQGYFPVVVNGVRTILHGYEVSLSSYDIDCTFIVSDSPPAVLVLQELSTPNVNGYLRTLSSLTKH